MPRIEKTSEVGKLKVEVSKALLDRYLAALASAHDAGLRVDVRGDFESLIRRLTKVIGDAVSEAQEQKQQQHQQHHENPAE